MPGIRTTREQLDDRFSVLGFNVKTERNPYFEVTIGTEPRLFQADRNRSVLVPISFHRVCCRRERGAAVYLVPTEVLSRFVGQPRLYFGLATFPTADRSQGEVVSAPFEGSPYVSLTSFTGRSLRRLMGLPNYRNVGAGYGTARPGELVWAGDAIKPGVEAVPVAATPVAAGAGCADPRTAKPAANAAALITTTGLIQNWTEIARYPADWRRSRHRRPGRRWDCPVTSASLRLAAHRRRISAGQPL